VRVSVCVCVCGWVRSAITKDQNTKSAISFSPTECFRTPRRHVMSCESEKSGTIMRPQKSRRKERTHAPQPRTHTRTHQPSPCASSEGQVFSSPFAHSACSAKCCRRTHSRRWKWWHDCRMINAVSRRGSCSARPAPNWHRATLPARCSTRVPVDTAQVMCTSPRCHLVRCFDAPRFPRPTLPKVCTCVYVCVRVCTCVYVCVRVCVRTVMQLCYRSRLLFPALSATLSARTHQSADTIFSV
jgi:hypothetical protein